MGYVTKISTAGASTLPTLGDIGYISKVGLKGLYLVNGGTGLTDASGAGANLTATHGTAPTYDSGGFLPFRSAAPVQLSTGVAIVGAAQTIVVALRKITNPTNGMIGASHVGGILSGNATSPLTLLVPSNGGAGTQAQVYGLQTKRPTVTAGSAGLNVWQIWTLVREATRVGLSLDGQPPVYVNYDTSDPGTNTTGHVVFGDANGGVRHINADFGFGALWQRTLSADEITSTYRAVRRMMIAKGLVL